MPSPTRRLTAADARRLVEQRCFRPGRSGRVGVELEQLAFALGDEAAPAPVAAAGAAVAAATPLPAGSRVTFEPGGQVEVSSPPLPGPAAACAAVATDLDRLRGALLDHGVALVARGVDPRPPRRVVASPRYDAMEAYFDGRGPEGRRMMCATASLQVNLDLGPQREVAARWRRAHALGPVLAAAFANSPAGGWRSARLATWTALDPTRTAPAHVGGRAGDPAEAWADYALDARVMLVRVTPRRFVPVLEHLPFARWLAEGHELGWPTEDDLAYHLTTLFPPVRPRGWLELRMLDALPGPWWQVAVAVTTALLDDPEAAERGQRATSRCQAGWLDAARHGLSHPQLGAAARACFGAALAAFGRLGVDPDTTAAAAEYAGRYVERGRCPADDPTAPLVAVEA